MPALAYPPYLPGRHAGHQGVIFHILGHNSPGGNHSATPYCMTTNYGTIGSQGSSLAYERARVRVMYRKMSPRGNHIREYARRATENIVFDFNAFVDGDVVLDADTIPDPDMVRHIDVLAQRTVPADDRSLLNMAEMPNFRPGADLDAVIHVTALVNEKVLHYPTRLSSFLSNHSRGHRPRL